MDIRVKPWSRSKRPRRILAIRLQAMGDVVITLPYLQYLQRSLPSTMQLDLLTRKETEAIPRSIDLFDKVISIGGGRSFIKQLLLTFLLIPRLWFRRYDIVIDLQNNILSRIARKAIFPGAWAEFDRFSPMAAGERTRLTIEAVCQGEIKMDTEFRLKEKDRGIQILQSNNWNRKEHIVVLNPAGVFVTRNWPLQYYVQFARLWLQQYPATKFVVLGIDFISSRAAYFQQQLGDRLINLVNKTSPADAFAVLQQATLVLSEDSGLMHMAWVSGIPTVALFGGTRSDWSRPLGEHTFFFDSSDLPCGNCMQETCRFGDVHCLTRYTPEVVFEQVKSLLLKQLPGFK